jgi:sulfopyruvate decarboxylase TPP-binding subunit
MAPNNWRPVVLDGPTVLKLLTRAGITDVAWIPDSELGTWETAFSRSGSLRLIRVCREGEAFAIAAGLLLGGRRPIVIIQCTGLFEAGDALRNIVHDLGLPVFMIVGVRSYLAHQRGRTADTCPAFTEPILRAWQIPFTVVDPKGDGSDLANALTDSWANARASAALLPE